MRASVVTVVDPLPILQFSGRATPMGWSEWRNVRYWHLADMPSCTAHVRFRGQSGHGVDIAECPLTTRSCHSVYCSTLPHVYCAIVIPDGDRKYDVFYSHDPSSRDN